VNTLGLKDHIGRIYFYPASHITFQGGSITLGSRRPDVWSTDSECKTKM